MPNGIQVSATVPKRFEGNCNFQENSVFGSR